MKLLIRLRTLASLAALALLTGAGDLLAQKKLTEHTIRRDPTAASMPASLDQLAFLAGHWQGEGFGGIVEEIWAPELGGSMIGAFKLVVDGAVEFQELMVMKADSNHDVTLALKHFDADLKGWEEKDDAMTFEFIKGDANHAWFGGLTFERVGDDRMNIYLAMRQEDGTTNEVVMNYYRVGSTAHTAWANDGVRRP